MRNSQRYRAFQLILQGRINGKRGPERQRTSWLANLRTWFNTTTVGLFRAAANKIKIAMMVANVRKEQALQEDLGRYHINTIIRQTVCLRYFYYYNYNCFIIILTHFFNSRTVQIVLCEDLPFWFISDTMLQLTFSYYFKSILNRWVKKSLV